MIPGFITAGALLSLVRNTVPWLELPAAATGHRALAAQVGGPQGFRHVLAGAAAAAGRDEPGAAAPAPHATETPGTATGGRADDGDVDATLDYFALCLAAHHATVASFVPTDVDSKIRGLLWKRVREPGALARMWTVASACAQWDVLSVSRRAVEVAPGEYVSGHDGERLSVLAGALGQALAVGAAARDVGSAARDAIAGELEREARAFQRLAATPGAEIPALVVAAALTHNAGDLDQGISFWPKSEAYRADAARFARLAHENVTPYGGAFAQAARLYKVTLAPEGHRHYPLRGVRALRQSHDLLLPVAPFLDDWGTHLARHPLLADEDLAQVMEALIVGSRKLAGQRGYYRALAGLIERLEGSRHERIVARMPASVRSEYRSAAVRRQLAVQRRSFESTLEKIVRGGTWKTA